MKISTLNHIENQNLEAAAVSQIVKCATKPQATTRVAGLPPHLVATRVAEFVTVDSGACDSIVPPSMFRNTPTRRHEEFGRTYAACGGETVNNIGIKDLKCLLDNGDIKNIPFQVGDKVTRGLLAVSQLSNLGAGIWFGPGPNFESYVVWDREAFVASAGPRQQLSMNNGTYTMPIREITRKSDEIAALGDDDSPQGEPEVAQEAPVTGGSGPSNAAADNQVEQFQDRDLINQGTINEDSSNPVVTYAAEQAPVRVIASPCQPSAKDVEEHDAAGHVPFRSWCPVCINASAIEAPHTRAKSEKDHAYPSFSSDYAFMGSKDNENKITLFVIKERKSNNIFVTVVPRKGLSETEFAIEFMLDCIAELGYAHHTIYLKNDQEPALQSVI